MGGAVTLTVYREQVLSAVRATRICSATTFEWFGARSGALPNRIRRALNAEISRSYLLFNLQNRLYRDFYCAGRAVATTSDGGAPAYGRTPFVQRLSLANSGRGGTQDGWDMRAHDGDGLLLAREGLVVRAAPSAIVGDAECRRGGAKVRLRSPKESLGVSPGFYMAFGDAALSPSVEGGLARLYFNLSPDGAVLLMGGISAELNGAGLPFRLKVLNNPAAFGRCDSVVLYFQRKDLRQVAACVAAIYPSIDRALSAAVPSFTKRLADGIGYAEDPGQGDSFGQHRCRLLAEGLIGAFESGRHAAADVLRAVEERFRAEGIDLDRPYQAVQSSDALELSLERRSQVVLQSPSVEAVVEDRAETWLAAAAEIGERLCDEAMWHDGACGWTGYLPDDAGWIDRRGGSVFCAMPGDLYHGTAGIALFLAELHALAPSEKIRRTAQGAFRQAIGWHERIPLESRFGLFTGWTGIALAGMRIAQRLRSEEIFDQSRALVGELCQSIGEVTGNDVMSGKAGIIAALLLLDGSLAGLPVRDRATELGLDLLGIAERDPAGAAWGEPALPRQRPLTGLSHGASGIAHALLELYRVTGDRQFLDGVLAAFAFERAWFDSRTGNWPDFRNEPRRRLPTASLTFGTTWCHGAPGIALVRARACALLGDQSCREEARIGLATTKAMIEAALSSGLGNYSLCHGLAGNADVLLHAQEMMGDDVAAVRPVAARVAASGLERHLRARRPWPCGAGGGETPGLMLGLAGIGYFYLRLASHDVRSVLILTG